MKRLLAILLFLCLLLLSVGCTSTFISTASTEEASNVISMADGEVNPSVIIDHALMFFYGESDFWYKGTKYPLNLSPFLDDGILYIPVTQAVTILGGSVVFSNDVYYINYKNNVSLVMEDYNVLLFNDDATVMDSTPIIKGGELCLPAEGIGKIFSMQFSKSHTDEIYVFGMPDKLSSLELKAVRKELGYEISAAEEKENGLLSISEKYNVDYDEIEEYAAYKELWTSDEKGDITHLWLDDAGSLKRKEYVITSAVPKNSIFTCKLTNNSQKLWDLVNKVSVSLLPDELYTLELKAATGKYMELKAAAYINSDENAAKLLDGYRAAISGDLKNEAYTNDLNEPYITGIYDNASGEEAWQSLIENARVGDFLVFSSATASAKYGYFNHSALIMEIDRNSGVMRLLQARGAEYGVGADLDMDYLTYSELYDEDYYKDYSVVFLCRAGNLNEAECADMALNAYKKYNGYQFGYGGRMGLKETNCTELIDEAYLSVGVDIVDGDYESRLKEVLKGNTQNLVLIPDDLLFSDITEVVAVWKR